MDFFFSQDNLARAVAAETKITSLAAQPYPDGRRLRVNLEITPYQQRPNIEIILKDADGGEAASTHIVEPLSWKLEFTMHLRGALRNPYTLQARLYYPDGPSAEPLQISLDIMPSTETPPQSPPEPDSE